MKFSSTWLRQRSRRSALLLVLALAFSSTLVFGPSASASHVDFGLTATYDKDADKLYLAWTNPDTRCYYNFNFWIGYEINEVGNVSPYEIWPFAESDSPHETSLTVDFAATRDFYVQLRSAYTGIDDGDGREVCEQRHGSFHVETPLPVPLDPPPLPEVSLEWPSNSGASWEGTNGTSFHEIQYNISVTGITDDDVRVDYEFVPGIATVVGAKVEQAVCNEDYFVNGVAGGPCVGSLTFEKGGSTTQSVPVLINDDAIAEKDQIFGFEIDVQPGKANLTTSHHVRGLILDDDLSLAPFVVTSPNVWINGEQADEYERIEPGDTIVAGDGTVTILLSDNESTIVIKNLGKIRIQSATVAKLIKGAAWFNRHASSWTVLARNLKALVKGTEFTVETAKRSDRVRVYDGTVKTDGKKGKAVTVKKGYETVCTSTKPCTKPAEFKASRDPFWESLPGDQ